MLSSAVHEIFLLINVKIPTVALIFTFSMSRKNSIIGLSEPEKAKFLDMFYTYKGLKLTSCPVEYDIFNNLGPRFSNRY